MLKRHLAALAISATLGLGFALHERSAAAAHTLHTAPAAVAQTTTR